MFFSPKQLNARQAQQKNSDANMDYFAVRFAIKSGDKQAAAMVESYAQRYQFVAGENLTQLRHYLVERS